MSFKKDDLPTYVDPEIVDIEELDIGGYVELLTKEKRKRKRRGKKP